MVVEYQTGTADNSLLGDKAQLPAVGGVVLTQRLHPIVVLVGAVRYAWHNLIHNRISWQPYTAANQHVLFDHVLSVIFLLHLHDS